MTRPDDFGFGDDAQLLKNTARRLFEDRLPADALHKLVARSHDPARASECAWDPDLWMRMIDLGWTAVAVPEPAGGYGMGLAAIAGLVEELGRAAVPSPLIATVCATYLLAACDSDPARALLQRIAGGASASLAHIDRRGSWQPDDGDVVATDTNVLSGTAWYVQDARKADIFVVKARTSAGVGFYAVEATSPGVTIIPDAIVDLTRDQAHVELRDVPAIALTDAAAQAWRAAEPALLVILAADMVGAAEWQLQTTAEYARTRVQFDRPIGFFQAVKHPLVDMMVMIDEARSLVYDAACAHDHEPASAEQLARMAKSAASDVAVHCSGRSVQLHGGIGFTWESFVHLYFKRQQHSAALYGDGAYHRARLADALIGPIGGGG